MKAAMMTAAMMTAVLMTAVEKAVVMVTTVVPIAAFHLQSARPTWVTARSNRVSMRLNSASHARIASLHGRMGVSAHQIGCLRTRIML